MDALPPTPSSPSSTEAIPTLAQIALALSARTERLQSIETLSSPVREEAVEIARDILEKLQLLVGNDSGEEALRAPETQQQQTAEAIATLTAQYEQQISRLAQTDSDALQHALFGEAREAIGSLNVLLLSQALQQAEQAQDASLIAQLTHELQKMPARWRAVKHAPIRNFLDKIAAALAHCEHLTRAQASVAPASPNMAAQTLNTANMRSASPNATMQAPASKQVAQQANMALQSGTQHVQQQRRQEQRDAKREGRAPKSALHFLKSIFQPKGGAAGKSAPAAHSNAKTEYSAPSSSTSIAPTKTSSGAQVGTKLNDKLNPKDIAFLQQTFGGFVTPGTAPSNNLQKPATAKTQTPQDKNAPASGVIDPLDPNYKPPTPDKNGPRSR